MSSNEQNVRSKGFFGHPRGLFTLFSTELWERFSYYGMRAILLYYMYYQVTKGGLGLSEGIAVSIMSVYGSLVYMSGVIGGWIADRVLGNRRTIFWGGVLIMCGHIALSFPGGLIALFISMFLIVMGTGLLKPNVSTVVGDLYSAEDVKRDAGFSIFYMGINTGAFVAPYIVGTIGLDVNFHLGFSLAAVGMALGLAFYVITGRKYLGDAGQRVRNPLEPKERPKIIRLILCGLLVILALLLIAWWTNTLTIKMFTYFISFLGLAIPACYFIVMLKSRKTKPIERSRVIAYIPLFIAAIMFWAIQEQGSSIIAVYADKRTQLDFLGIHINQTWFQSVNPIIIIIFAPIFAALWTKLGKRQPTTPRKFTIGLILAGFSFLVLTVPAVVNGTHTLVNPLWPVLSLFLVTIGELCLSPVGLSATTKLAPAAFSAQTMSLWLLADAAGQGINAQITPLYGPNTEIVYFGIVGVVSVVLGVILFFLSPMIHRYMRGLD